MKSFGESVKIFQYFHISKWSRSGVLLASAALPLKSISVCVFVWTGWVSCGHFTLDNLSWQAAPSIHTFLSLGCGGHCSVNVMSEHCLQHTVCICDESDVTTSNRWLCVCFQLCCSFNDLSLPQMFPHCSFIFLCVIVFFACFSWQSAVGHDYQSKLSKHCSQTDTSRGFGGKFGVQSDRVDQVFPVAVNH